jgi:hypothetical protein
MNEATLTRGLRKALALAMPGAETIKHADGWTSGIPDLSHTWAKHTSWAEVKLDKPGSPMRSRGIQERTCGRLARNGRCVYVLYFLQGTHKRVEIRQPTGKHPLECPLILSAPGWNHAAVAEHIRTSHVLGVAA